MSIQEVGKEKVVEYLENEGIDGTTMVDQFTSIEYSTVGKSVAIRLTDVNEYWEKHQAFTGLTALLNSRRRNIGARGQRVAWYQTRAVLSNEELISVLS